MANPTQAQLDKLTTNLTRWDTIVNGSAETTVALDSNTVGTLTYYLQQLSSYSVALITAADASGLRLEDDGGNGFTLADGGHVTFDNSKYIYIDRIQARDTTGVEIYNAGGKGIVVGDNDTTVVGGINRFNATGIYTTGAFSLARSIMKEENLASWSSANPIARISGFSPSFYGALIRVTLINRGDWQARAEFRFNAVGAGAGDEYLHLISAFIDNTVDITGKIHENGGEIEIYSTGFSNQNDTLCRVEVLSGRASYVPFNSITVTINPGATNITTPKASAVKHGLYLRDTSVIVSVAALSTTATKGFLYIPTSAGPPTGTPTSYTGTVPIEYDTTNNKLYIYNGAWKSVTLS